MPFMIPAEVYIEFEEVFGKERAKRIIKAFESMIDTEIVNKWAQTKFELRDELLKDLVTKVEFEARIGSLRDELTTKNESLRAELTEKIESVRNELTTKIESVRSELTEKIESVRVELRKEIENAFVKLEKRFTIMFLILLFAMIFLNRDALEFILKLLKLI